MPNLSKEIVTIIYVTDPKASLAFYSELLEIEPGFISPRYITMDLAPGVAIALWSGEKDALKDSPVRTSEISLNIPGGAEEIKQKYQEWKDKGVSVLKEPYEDVFGLTFIAQDPDGNLIRVAPID